MKLLLLSALIYHYAKFVDVDAPTAVQIKGVKQRLHVFASVSLVERKHFSHRELF